MRAGPLLFLRQDTGFQQGMIAKLLAITWALRNSAALAYGVPVSQKVPVCF